MRSTVRIFTMIYLGLSNFVLAQSPSWELNCVNGGWNNDLLVRTYFHNSELQRQWAWELIGKQHLQGNETILDFGCGDGKITAEISRLLDTGKIIGVDISSEMVSFAKIKFPSYAYPNLEYKHSSSLAFDDFIAKPVNDYIFSFCVFHVTPRPVEILSNLKKHLKPTGKLVLVVPSGRNKTLFDAADAIFDKYQLTSPWKNGSNSVLTMRTLDGCTAILQEVGFKVTTLEMIDTDTPFYSKEELVDWFIGTTTANWNIPLSIASVFFRDLVERMVELDSDMIDHEGRVHFKLSRIHVVATKEA